MNRPNMHVTINEQEFHEPLNDIVKKFEYHEYFDDILLCLKNATERGNIERVRLSLILTRIITSK